jgi:cytochrome P450
MPTGVKLATDIVVDAKLVDLETDPYPTYAMMRRECPIAFVPETGRLWITTWDLCAEAGNNYDVFGPTQEVFTRVYGQPNVMSLTGEAHLAARRPLDARFRPRAVNAYAEAVIRPTAIRYIESVRGRGAAELSGDVLEPVSLRAIGDVMGFGDVDDETLARWFQSLGRYLVDFGCEPTIAATGEAVKGEIRAYLEQNAGRHRAAHDGSTLAHMFRDGLPDGEIRKIDEIIGTVGVMIVGGFQEPAHGTANTMLGLLSNPGQAKAVAKDPQTHSAEAVKEGLRWIAPFGMTEKLTTRDVVLGERVIPAGTEIALVLGSANRDESRFEEPDRFDLHRPNKAHASFGYGAHFCVGNYVARQLAQICVEELFRRLPGLKLDPEKEPTVHGWAVRAAKSLPVIWET